MNVKTVELYSQDGQRIIVNESDVAYFRGKGFGEKPIELKESEKPEEPKEPSAIMPPADANQSNVNNAEPEQPSESAKTKKPKQTGAV